MYLYEDQTCKSGYRKSQLFRVHCPAQVLVLYAALGNEVYLDGKFTNNILNTLVHTDYREYNLDISPTAQTVALLFQGFCYSNLLFHLIY